MAELAVAGSAIGIISAGIQVWWGLISYYEPWKGCHKYIYTTVETIATFSGILEIFPAVLENQIDKEAPLNKYIDDIVSQCKRDMDTLSVELAKFETYPQSAKLHIRIKSQLRRWYYPFREGTLASLRDTVHNARSNLLPALAVLQLDKSMDFDLGKKDTKASLVSQLDKSTILEKRTQDVKASLVTQRERLVDLNQLTKDMTISMASQRQVLVKLKVATKDTNLSLALTGSSMSLKALNLHLRWLNPRTYQVFFAMTFGFGLERPTQTSTRLRHPKNVRRPLGSWFLHSSQYIHWKEQPNSLLWLHGFVGCGKTILG